MNAQLEIIQKKEIKNNRSIDQRLKDSERALIVKDAAKAGNKAFMRFLETGEIII